MLIVFFILFLLTTQNIQNKVEEHSLLSFCFLSNSTLQNKTSDIDIFCSGNEYFVVLNNDINNDNNDTFTNITIICNKQSCKIKGKNDKKCQNCNEISLICYKGRCIRGPSQNHFENNNTDENTEGNKKEKKNNNTKDNDPLNDNIISINCFNNICNKNYIDDKNDDNTKLVLFLIISISWISFSILNFIILLFSFGVCTCNLDLLFIIIFAPFCFIYILISICFHFKLYSFNSYSRKKKKNSNKFKWLLKDEDFTKSEPTLEEESPRKIKINNEDISNDINDLDIFANDEEIEKKRIIIQNHSKSSDIEEYDKKFYLVNKKEVDITIMLCHSLKKTSKNIAVFTFNKGQVNLIKQKFKDELSFVNVVLLNENCTNFYYSDYIIINYIDSQISKESMYKYHSDLYSRKFFTDEFCNKILENYTGKMLYLVCNYDYLKKPLDNIITTEKLKIPKAITYKEIQVPNINREYVSNDYNICFIIDNTGSMEKYINAVKSICINLFKEIVKKYRDYKFYFGSVLYADKPSISSDENFKIDFTENESEFKSKLKDIKIQNGDDEAEDWVSGFRIALEELNWENGTKLIFHIADAPQHGKIFNTDKKWDNFLKEEDDIHGKNLIKLIKECSKRNIKITGISINNVCSFKVFKSEYEKLKGPKYEIIEFNNNSEYINKKLFDIVEKSVNENKAIKFLK